MGGATHRHKIKRNEMKTLNHLCVMTAAVVALNLTARASEPVFSPKAAQLQHELRKVASMPGSVDLAKVRPAGTARAWSLAQDFRKVSSAGPDVDLVHAPRPILSPKDLRFENAFRELASAKSLVAK
jgi:hypothetical protein